MTHRQQGSLLAAVILGTSLGVIRLVPARTFGDLLLAGCLTAAELSVVLFIEKKARQLDIDIEAVKAQSASFDKSERRLDMSKEELVRRQGLCDQTEQAIAKIDQDFELDHEMGDLKCLITVATNAARAGYHRGIAENSGELGGV